MSDTAIIRIPILPLGIVNAHLIRGADGCILVDAGIPGSERGSRGCLPGTACRSVTSGSSS